MSFRVMQVTKQQISDYAVVEELKGIESDFEDGSIYGQLLEKQVKRFNPNASPEELHRAKERCRQKLTLGRIEKARLEADEARRRLEKAQAKLAEDQAKQAKTTLARRTRPNKRYLAIDGMLIDITKAKPLDHKEVFELLDSRGIRIPPAEPFKSARGWIAGFQKDPPRAHAWLSKRWRGLDLPRFLSGPKWLQ
jgi:hypothetical protein